MNLICFLLFVTPSVFSDIERMDGFRASFTVANKGRMLYPTVLMYVEDVDIGECANTCGMYLSCATFNYNWDTRECELVDQDFDGTEADIDAPGWYHYGTPVKIDGGFTHWFSTAPCSTSCGDGLETLYRTCTSPEPKYGGQACIGEDIRTVKCNINPCPIDGGFDDWVNGSCSSTCGVGQIKQTRTCTLPVPQHGGADCVGDKTRTVSCNNTQPCPPINIAKGKPSTQSSIHSHYVAKNGNDGTTATIAITKKTSTPWWFVDLQDIKEIKYMILNSLRTTKDHNKALVVETRQDVNKDWKKCTDVGEVKYRHNYKFTCDVTTRARYVRIIAMGFCHLYFYEFQVYADL